MKTSFFCFISFVLQSVIDGDLCEYFNSLDSSKRRNIAEELDRTPAEVLDLFCCLFLLAFVVEMHA